MTELCLFTMGENSELSVTNSIRIKWCDVYRCLGWMAL